MRMSPFAVILGCLAVLFSLGTLRFLGCKDCLQYGVVPPSLSHLLGCWLKSPGHLFSHTLMLWGFTINTGNAKH